MENYVSLTLGMLCAGAGVELLLRGTLGLAAWLRVPATLIRAVVTLLVYASAEFAVVVEASRILRPDLALGAALGTSIVNLGLVLAIALLSPAVIACSDARPRACIMAIVAPLSVAFFARDGRVSRTEGCILLGLFACWLWTIVREERANAASDSAPEEPIVERRGWIAVSFCFVGLLLLASTGRLLVDGVEGLVADFQLDYFALGATLVPLCIAVPALTSAFATKYRSAGGVSAARLLNNSVLNAWLLGGIAATMAPFRVAAIPVAATAACAAVLALLAWPSRHIPSRARGLLLAAVYAAFLYYLL